MQHTPPLALRLLQTARLFASNRQHRRAALAYSAVTKCRGTSSEVKANALFYAAIHLVSSLNSSSAETCDEDRLRAIGFLQKCSVLLKNCPGSFDQRMKVAGMLEYIYTECGDHQAVEKTIRAALEDITRSTDASRTQVLKWWVYYRCRSISNASIAESNKEYALTIALDSAQQSLRHGEKVAAAAFHLVHCQIALSLPVCESIDVMHALRQARQSLDMAVSGSQGAGDDLRLLYFCFNLFSAYARMRNGLLTEAAEKILPHLKNSYDQLRQAFARSSKRIWNWVSPEVATALAFHAIADVNRCLQKKTNPRLLISSALKAVGIQIEAIGRFDPQTLHVPGLSPQAGSTLLAALLERAARLQLTSVQIRATKDILRVAVQVAFPDRAARAELAKLEKNSGEWEGLPDATKILPNDLSYYQLMAKCSVLMLVAEYHILRGWVSSAQIATQLLYLIRSSAKRFTGSEGREFVTDTWQMAMSYISLLEGDCRPGDIPKSLTENSQSQPMNEPNSVGSRVFANRTILGVAWFTIGVFYMRKSDIIESRKAIRVALNLQQGASGFNDQVTANSMVIQSSMTLAHEKISPAVGSMISTANDLASRMDDLVTLLRARKLHKKLLTRTGYGHLELDQADQTNQRTQVELFERQKVEYPHVVPS